MKKTLSLVLALIMTLSCFSVLTVSAEDGDISDMLYTEESIGASQSALKNFTVNNLPERFDYSLEELKETDIWDNVNLMGISLDFLYSGTGLIDWSKLDVFVTVNGEKVYGPDGLPIRKITSDDISLAMTNINIYLQRIFYDAYGGLGLYTIENAINMANFIGKALRSDFVELNVDNYRNYFGNEVPSANEFFKGVTKLSGLDVIIDHNWLTPTRGQSFCEPLANLLGGGYITFLNEYFTDGLVLGSKILEGMVKKILSVGPVDYIYDIVNVFTTSAYALTYRTPVLALFSQKIAKVSAHYTVEELNSFTGLLKLIFCDCNPLALEGCYAPVAEDVDHFCPFDFPVERFSSITDKDEKMIYAYYYLNLCGRYRGNSDYFKGVQNKISANFNLSEDDKSKLNALIDGFFLGNFSVAVDLAIVPLYKENIDTAPDSIFDRLKNTLMIFIKKIADYLDYLRKVFTGELDYGQGNSPFN